MREYGEDEHGVGAWPACMSLACVLRFPGRHLWIMRYEENSSTAFTTPATILCSHIICFTQAKIFNPNAASITFASCMRPCRVLSRISQLTVDETRSRIWRETCDTHDSTSVCEHKDDLACDEHGPRSTSVVIMPVVRLNSLNYNHASLWSGRVASLQRSTRVRTAGCAHVHDTASMSYVVTRAMKICCRWTFQ